MNCAELAQAIYESAWPGEHLDDALPEIRATFRRMAKAAATHLHITLEDQ